MNNELHRWRQEATPNEWEKLASLSMTTPGYLNQIAYGNRRASVDLATLIATATNRKEFKRIKPITKESLVFATTKAKAKAA